MLALQFSVLFVLLGLSAVFSAAESAITVLSSVRMKRMAIVSPSLAPYLIEWLAHPHRLLSVLMVGNNLVNISFSSLAAVAAVPLSRVLPSHVVGFITWLSVTAVLLVAGDIVPKIFGRVYRERVAEWILPLLSRFTRVCFFIWGPIGWLLKKAAPDFSRAPVNMLTLVSVEELHHVIAESQAAGHMSGESGEMFRRVLSLPTKTVREVGRSREEADTLPLEILGKPGGEELFIDLLVETGRTRVPVTEKGRAAGYVNVLDILKWESSGVASPLRALVRPLIRVAPQTKATDILEKFRKSGESVAAIEDTAGAFDGLVTIEDVLEEVVGEILDEYDLERQGGRA